VARKDKTEEAVTVIEIFMEELEGFYKQLSNVYTIETVNKYVEVFAAASEMMYTQYMRDIFPAMTDAISTYFSQLDELNIKTITK
jgi:hypothetical protein